MSGLNTAQAACVECDRAGLAENYAHFKANRALDAAMKKLQRASEDLCEDE